MRQNGTRGLETRGRVLAALLLLLGVVVVGGRASETRPASSHALAVSASAGLGGVELKLRLEW